MHTPNLSPRISTLYRTQYTGNEPWADKRTALSEGGQIFPMRNILGGSACSELRARMSGLLHVQQPYVVVFGAVLGLRVDLGGAEQALQLLVGDGVLEVRVNPVV